MADADITAQRLREVLDYCQETGAFTRKIRLAQRHQVGDRADFIVTGGSLKGYRRVGLDGRRVLAHRLAWLHVHGEWPKHDIDHINGDKGDNRIANLRDVERRVNLENQRKPRANNATSGLLGVHLHAPGRWKAVIQVQGRLKYLGLFDTAEEGHQAYLAAKRKLHEGCSI